MSSTCFAFGFQCDDGWYDLIYNTIRKLDFFSQISGVGITIEQVKEKFGELRIYYNPLDMSLLAEDKSKFAWGIVNDIIDNATTTSKNTCEVCGKKGTLCAKGSWCKTLCYNTVRNTEEYKEFIPVSEWLKALWTTLDKAKENQYKN
ncbi:MAG: hypothetical protein HWN81_19335 [Candidatus Lokiarchaeota archaeon]|nr:hypothetical protein [Candidatus Lokiarchaeota archaeon]